MKLVLSGDNSGHYFYCHWSSERVSAAVFMREGGQMQSEGVCCSRLLPLFCLFCFFSPSVLNMFFPLPKKSPTITYFPKKVSYIISYY